MTRSIPELEALASKSIGDGKSPELYFVTDRGVVVTVSRDYTTAKKHYDALANRTPLCECALEARSYGVVAAVSPVDDDSSVLHREYAPEKSPV